MGGWYLPAWKGKKRILSAKKRFIKSSQKKAHRKQPFLFIHNRQKSCFRRILVKNGTKINSPIVASVVVITSLGKHVFSEEFIQRNNAIG